MKSVILSVSLFLLAISGAQAVASGFDCSEVGGGYHVLLRNHVHSERGTRTPAVLVVSREAEGTLLVREGDEIRKHIRANSTQYVVDGNEKLSADTVIFQLPFREGRSELENGETVDAQLILIQGDERNVHALECSRYLKD